MDKYVYDSIGNPHERKNLYLKDLSENIKVDRKTHPYIIELEKIKEKERVFSLNKVELKVKKVENKDIIIK